MSDTEFTPVTFAFRNMALARRGATVTASSEASEDLRAERLIDGRSDTGWGSADFGTSNETFIVELGQTRSLDFFGLFFTDVRLRVRCEVFSAAGAGGSAVYDSGWSSGIVKAPWEAFSYSTMPYTLGPRDDLLDDLAARYRLPRYFKAPSPVAARSIRWSFETAGYDNDGLSRLRVGNAYAARSLTPRINFRFGAAFGTIDRSKIQTADSGKRYGRRLPPGKTFECDLGYLTESEGLRTLLREIADTTELDLVAVDVRPSETEFFYDHFIVGRLLDGGPKVEFTQSGVWSAKRIQIEEEP